MGATESDIVRKAEAILASVKSFTGGYADRHALMKQVNLLYQELEDPMEAMVRQWTFMNSSTALDVMVQFKAFENMPKQGSITAKELGALINLEPSVVVRLMRMLTGTGIVALTGKDTYAHTPKSMAYLESTGADFYKLCINMMPCYLQFPEYFKTKTPEELIDLRKTPYSYTYGNDGQTFYEVLTATPERLNMFNKAMMQQESHLPILGMFPFKSLEQEVKAEPERAFMVDIGGGRGQCLLEVQQETDGIFGTGSKMILQERPEVLDTIPQEMLPNIEKMPYDFYTEQTVKNAHVYYLRRILHNYQDNICIPTLRNVAAAMGPTSRILIAEIIIPDMPEVGEDMVAYWMDMVMLSIGGKERTKEEFEALLDAAGLELVKIWPFAVGAQTVIEARLKRA